MQNECFHAEPDIAFGVIYLFFSLDSADIHHDAAAVETRTAPYGSTVVMDCRTDLEPPVDFSWSKQGGALPRDSSTRDVS
jgi:hypothetical protein